MVSQDVQVYTWSGFQAAVRALVPIDYARLGSVPALIDAWTRICIIELQNLIPAYRSNHETIYHASDFVLEGMTCRTTLPPQAKVKDAYLVTFDDCNSCNNCNASQPIANSNFCRRFPLTDFNWDNRMALVHGRIAVNGGNAYISFDPQSRTFYVYPGIKDCQLVSVFWEGLKINFQPNEQVPFTEQTTQVVADYLKARLSREVDKDLPLAESYMNSYQEGRSLAYLEAKDRRGTNQ